jgi:hypothetical protein
MRTRNENGASTARECRSVRERLFAAGLGEDRRLGQLDSAAGNDDLRRHIESCRDCTVLADRLELARQSLGRPLSNMQPDPGFSARVVSRIGRPEDLLGWAAFRALPAALGLALALACFGFVLPAATPAPAATTAQAISPLLLDEAPSTDQMLAWSAQPPEVWP